MPDDVFLKIVEDYSTGDFKEKRRILSGYGVNDCPCYPGCTGFHGWDDVCLLSDGEMLCTFSGGYWHVSYPTPVDLSPEKLKTEMWITNEVDAPTGGRALISRSHDYGGTWTVPVTLFDSPWDDRHPTIIELADGSLLCAFFMLADWYGYPKPPKGKEKNSRVAVIKSTDRGGTWSEPLLMPSPYRYYDRMRSKMVLLPSGSVLLAAYSCHEFNAGTELSLFRTDDGGKSWNHIPSDGLSGYEIDEPAICLADNGVLIMAARPDGAFSFSRDEGRSWSKPCFTGIKMIAPCLYKMKNGTIVCLYGRVANEEITTNSIQIIWSNDNGLNWISPSAANGFVIDSTAYLYANCCELPDGALFITYYNPVDSSQRRTAVMRIKMRLRADGHGIDILNLPDGNNSQPPVFENLPKADSKMDVDA